MSYYKYQQRVKADQEAVDYGQIQTGLNKAFEEIQTGEADKREGRETDIAELRTNVNKELEQAREAARTNKGDDTFNGQVLSMANQSAQHMRALEQLLRAGKINPSDYAIQRQNLIDSVTQLRVVTAAYKDSIDQAVTRQEDGSAGAQEAFMMSKVQGVLDLKNHQLMIDPKTGMVRMHDNVNGTSEGVGDVQVRMMNKYNKYDFTGKVGEYTKLLDTVIEDNGYVRTEDPFSLAGGRNLKASIRENFVNGISENDKASILLDSSEGYKELSVDSESDYDAWRSKEEAKMKASGSTPAEIEEELDKYIWYKPNSELAGRTDAVLSDGAKEAVVEKAIREIKSQTKYSETITPKAPTRDQRQAQEDTDVRIKDINRMRELYRGNASQKSGVLGTYSKQLDAMVPKDHVLKEAKVSKDGLVISYYDPEYPNELLEKTIPADTSSEDAFVKSIGPALTGDDNLLSVLDEAGDSGTDAFVDETGTLSVKRTVTIPWEDVEEDGIIKMKRNATLTERKADAMLSVKEYISLSKNDSLKPRISGDYMVLTIGGVEEKVWLGADADDIEETLTALLKKSHSGIKSGDVSTKGGELD